MADKTSLEYSQQLLELIEAEEDREEEELREDRRKEMSAWAEEIEFVRPAIRQRYRDVEQDA